MARLKTCGAEIEVGANVTGRSPEADTVNGTVTRDTAVKRSGLAAFKCDTTASNVPAYLRLMPTTQTYANSTIYFFRGYYCFSALPATLTNSIMQFGNEGSANGYFVRLTTAGKLQLWGHNVQIGSDSAVTISADSTTFYRIELSVTLDASAAFASAELQLNGVTVASESGRTDAITTPNIYMGWSTQNGGGSPGASKFCWVDDIAINDNNGADQNGFPGSGKVVLLLPIANSAAGTGWQKPGGTNAAMYTSVDNTPPVGVADSTSAAQAENMIRNATSAANSNYDADMTTYTSAGVGASDIVNVLLPVICTAAPVTTSAKQGTFGVVSNPAIANVALGISGISGAFWSGVAAGTYPTGWKWSYGTITYTPTVTLGTSPVMRVTQVTASTRIAMVCAMFIYCDYSPPGVTAYQKTGSILAGAAIAGPDAVIWSEAGRVLAGAVASGDSASTRGKSGSVLSRAVASALEAYQAVLTGSIVAGSVLSGLSAKLGGGKSGFLLAGTVLAGADVRTATESGSVVAGSVLSGADVREASETGSVLAGLILSAADVREAVESGAILPAVLLSGSDVHEAVESGSVLTSPVLSAADAREAIESGSVLPKALISGADATERARTAAVLAAATFSGADVAERSEMGSIVTRAITSAPSQKDNPGKTGSVVTGTVVSGSDSHEAVETGSVLPKIVESGPSVRQQAGKTGSVVTGAIMSGADSAQRAETGSVLASAILSGADAEVYAETGRILASVATFGADVYETSKTGRVLTGVVLSGPKARVVNKTGAIVAGTTVSALDSEQTAKAGAILSSAMQSGSDVFIATESGSILVATEVKGHSALGLQKSGSTLVGVIISGSKTEGVSVMLEAIKTGRLLLRGIRGHFGHGSSGRVRRK